MSPTVIALTGLPGTGKSRLGFELGQRLPRDVSYVDLDTLTQPLVRAALAVNGLSPESAADRGILRTLRDAQYACLWSHVRQLVGMGKDVLFVAPMTHELEDPAAFSRVVAALRPARLVLVRIHASAAVARSRIERRGDLLDALRLTRWDADRHRYDDPAPLPMEGLELDSSDREPHALVEDVLQWLERQISWSGHPAHEAGRRPRPRKASDPSGGRA